MISQHCQRLRGEKLAVRRVLSDVGKSATTLRPFNKDLFHALETRPFHVDPLDECRYDYTAYCTYIRVLDV